MKLYVSPRAPSPRRVLMFLVEKGITGIDLVNIDLTPEFCAKHKLFSFGYNEGASVRWFGPGYFVAYAVRDNLDAIALVAFRENPVVGTGLAQFTPRYAPLEVHNTVLGVAAETGFLGLAALSVLLAYLMTRAVRLGGGEVWAQLGNLAVLLAVFLLHWIHFLFRERWMWLFFLLVAYLAAGVGRAASGSVSPECAQRGISE